MKIKMRHRITFAILKPIFTFVLFFTYRFKAKKYKLSKEPHLILSNHQTTMDPFLLSLSFKGPIYFMASEDLFVKGFVSKIIKFLAAPFAKKKGTSDVGAVRYCMQVVKAGGNISIFPEGNRTYSGKQCYIDPAIVKLMKLLKIPVVLYNICGGYGTSPRWASGIRYGKMYGKVVAKLSPEIIEELNENELYTFVLDKLDVEDAPSNIRFKSRRRAKNLERVLYICPQCGHINTLYSKRNYVKCTQCELNSEYTEYLTFKGVKFNTVNDWYTYQEEYIKNYQFENEDEIIFEDEHVSLYETTRSIGSDYLGYGKLSITKKDIILKCLESCHRFKLSSIDTMTIIGKHKLNFYIENRTYQLKGRSSLNVLKYMQIYYRIKGVSNELFRL